MAVTAFPFGRSVEWKVVAEKRSCQMLGVGDQRSVLPLFLSASVLGAPASAEWVYLER